MGKSSATNADMRSTIFDYEWKEVGEERGGPIKGIREKLLAVDPENGAYTRVVIFEPGFKFDNALEHPFWEELLLLEGHMTDYGTHTVYTKGFYALRPPGLFMVPSGRNSAAPCLKRHGMIKTGICKSMANHNAGNEIARSHLEL